MAKDVSSDFKSGHSDGQRDARNWDSKDELSKWVSSASDLLSGNNTDANRGTPGHGDYKAGHKQGVRDYRNR